MNSATKVFGLLPYYTDNKDLVIQIGMINLSTNIFVWDYTDIGLYEQTDQITKSSYFAGGCR